MYYSNCKAVQKQNIGREIEMHMHRFMLQECFFTNKNFVSPQEHLWYHSGVYNTT